ncbi:DUF3103 family protein [Thalassomonas haliotis]|uniref:DUF3103 family protein n=1 Tax=Thalassomonas haliotis TaxID=485448 RepID=A0ABY7VBI0_9GAMM|nr:DUF3103 family protein [Thalassomonas haliotis]WDE10691.1 DUF3103 family protein [Thalassomonas haliotis]
MKKLPTSLMLLLSMTAFAGQASTINPAEAKPVSSQVKAKVNLTTSKRLMAQDISRQYSKISSLLHSEITQYNLKVNVDNLLSANVMDTKQLQRADLSIKSAKGLESVTESLVELRLAHESMLAAWQAGESPLFAFAPEGNDSQWDYIEAYDVDGNIELLDAYEMPERPVFVVGVDGQRSLKEGLQVMRSVFAGGSQVSKSALRSVSASAGITADDGSLSTTVIKKIHLNDDQEPWISGDAEIYGIVNGVDPSRDEPYLDIVEMPYLDNDGTTYSPNQIAIYWDRYRWSAADMILMEHDDGTNYKDLATALLEAATAIMRLIPDPAVQGYAIIPQITNGIISAMPDAWFTNDDDYVDVYYTLFEGRTYNDHMGAGGNAKTTFEPLEIAPR